MQRNTMEMTYIPLEYIIQTIWTTIPDWHFFQTKQSVFKLE